ncbi:MAG: type I restriction-modification system subunit M N-terminal domain-containing protein [Chromatiaceae bacterium]|nr:type I restriction-modification system subunit M N-terminal domain-containing protein [Chromatiaceae bacterium]
MATETNNTDLARAEILWKSVDALRGQIDAAEYKHVVLGLLFLKYILLKYFLLKYISDSFEARRDEPEAKSTGTRWSPPGAPDWEHTPCVT